MSFWLFRRVPDPIRPWVGRRILEKLLRSSVPVDGDFGRVRRAADPVPYAGGSASRAAGEAPRPTRTAARPALPMHARSAVEEWIPPGILYGPPR